MASTRATWRPGRPGRRGLRLVVEVLTAGVVEGCSGSAPTFWSSVAVCGPGALFVTTVRIYLRLGTYQLGRGGLVVVDTNLERYPP